MTQRPLIKFIRHPIGLTLTVILAGVIAVLIMFYLTSTPDLDDGDQVTVKIDKAVIEAKVAAKDESQAKGLIGSPPLNDKQGMLFAYPAPIIHAFIMRGMSFPIDIIWVNGDTVTEVTANLQPQPADVSEAQMARYSPSAPVDKVIEVMAGWAASHGIQPGDPIRITR